MKKEKSLMIDYAKSIGIMLVVAGHLSGQPLTIYQPYIFHMPLFFFIGGLLFNENRKLTIILKSSIIKHIPYVVYTYIIIGVIALLANALFGVSTGKAFDSGIWSSITLAFKNNMHNNPLFLVAWFLIAYIIASVFFGALIKIVTELCANSFLSNITMFIIATAISYYAVTYLSPHYKQNHYQFENIAIQVCYGGFFYTLGFLTNKLKINIYNLYAYIGSYIVLSILISSGFVNPFFMAWSTYFNGFASQTIGSVLCIYGVMYVSHLLTTINPKSISLIAFIGTKSREIMAYHALAFLLLDVLFIRLNFTTLSYINNNNHYLTVYTWYLYFVFGVSFPLCCGLLFKSIKSKIPMIRAIILS